MERVIHDFATGVLMSSDEAKDICRLGKGEECCAYLICGTNGFECIKMSYPLNSSIYKRLEEGTMNAKGIGEWDDCPWKNACLEEPEEKEKD